MLIGEQPGDREDREDPADRRRAREEFVTDLAQVKKLLDKEGGLAARGVG